MKLLVAPMKNYRKTSSFGRRNTGIAGASTDHKGIDMVSSDTNLYLCAEGVLERAFWNDFRGWTCEFSLGDNYSILYQHMKFSCTLEIGKRYIAETIVGIMGASRSEERIPVMREHLHFELRKNGVPINPERWLFDIEIRKLIKPLPVISDGENKTVKAISVDGENYVRLRDHEEVLNLESIGFDKAKNMPIINKKN